jgi:membrane protease YdiL (CAAX protease family)
MKNGFQVCNTSYTKNPFLVAKSRFFLIWAVVYILVIISFALSCKLNRIVLSATTRFEIYYALLLFVLSLGMIYTAITYNIKLADLNVSFNKNSIIAPLKTIFPLLLFNGSLLFVILIIFYLFGSASANSLMEKNIPLPIYQNGFVSISIYFVLICIFGPIVEEFFLRFFIESLCRKVGSCKGCYHLFLMLCYLSY